MLEGKKEKTEKNIVTDPFGKYAQEGKTSYKLGTNKIVSYRLTPSGMIHKKEETGKKTKEKKFPYSEAKKDMNKIFDEIMEKTKPKNETPEQHEERLHRRRWGIPHPKNQKKEGKVPLMSESPNAEKSINEICDDVMEKAKETEWKATGKMKASKQSEGKFEYPTTTSAKFDKEGKNYKEVKQYGYDPKRQIVNVESWKYSNRNPDKPKRKMISAVSEMEKELKEASMNIKDLIKSVMDRSLGKNHSYVYSGETEESLKKKKKQPKKVDSHTVAADPKIRAEGEMEPMKLSVIIDELIEKAEGKKTGYYSYSKDPKTGKEKEHELGENTLREEMKIAEERDSKKSIDERTFDLAKDIWDTLKEQDQAKRSEVAMKERIRRNKMNESARKEYERANRQPAGYDWKPKEKSIDEKTVDYLAKANKQIADAVRVVRLHKEGMHKEANKIASDVEPEYVQTAARKYNAMSAQTTQGSMGKSIDERVCDLFKAGEYGDEKIKADEYPYIDSAQRKAQKAEIEKRAKMERRMKQPGQNAGVWEAKPLSFMQKKEKSNFIRWKSGDGIVSGGRIIPIGSGGQIQNLVKDEKELSDDEGSE